MSLEVHEAWNLVVASIGSVILRAFTETALTNHLCATSIGLRAI